MRIETDNRDVAAALRGTARVLTRAGAAISDDLIVREADGTFTCAASGPPGRPGRRLVSYAPDLRPPMTRVRWRDDGDRLTSAADLSGLASPHRELVDLWLQLVECTDKVPRIRAALPWIAVTDPAIRAHLATWGFAEMATTPPPVAARNALIALHSGSDPVRGPQLVPLKNLVNHRFDGAAQEAVPGMVAVVTSATSDEHGTYEYYGDLDALQLAVWHGYLDDSTTFVHALPGSVSVGAARVNVLPADDGNAEPRPPSFRATDQGLAIAHLTFRQRNRDRLVALLAMALAARLGLAPDAAAGLARRILAEIHTATDDAYRQLSSLVATSRSLATLQRSLLAGVAGRQREVLANVRFSASGA